MRIVRSSQPMLDSRLGNVAQSQSNKFAEDPQCHFPAGVALRWRSDNPETGQSSNHGKSSEYWIARSRSWSRKSGSKSGRAMTK